MNQLFNVIIKSKMLPKGLVAICLFFQSIIAVHAQVITLGGLSFGGTNFAGPANTSTTAGASSRYAYIFPSILLSQLKHGDSIRSLSFHRNAGSGINGSCSMKIYIRNTVSTTYGPKNINWVNQTGATGMKKVYDGDPGVEIGSKNGWVRFSFSSAYIMDTLFGKNLEILIEYKQFGSQTESMFWTYESSGTVPGYQPNQVKFVRTNGGTLTDTTNSTTELHPSIKIEFPRHDYDLAVGKIYSLGKLPVPLGNPDTVKAFISNVGKKGTTFTVFLMSRGANTLIDSATYSLASLEEELLSMPLLYPSNTGLDSLIVMIARDQNKVNNSNVVMRLATSNIYSYKDPMRPISGGIGFNGSTGDFVAKFHSNTQKSINQVSVSFAGSNQKFKLGMWKADGIGGRPKTNIWTSDTLVSAPNFVTPVWPPVPVNGPFYIGVRQIGTNNVAFGYQPETPVRTGTFYYTSPTGDTSWVDFAPDAPFRFVIEPRLQAKKDVAPIKLEFPRDTMELEDVVTLAPKATILNYGSDDQLTPFNIKINIFRNNFLEYTSTRKDTLSSGLKRLITFDSTFFPNSAGDYIVHIITSLPGDEMKDNDTMKVLFVVAAFKDVGPGTIFDPGNGVEYEQYVDTIFPTVYIQNYGLDKQGPFNVTAEIYDSLQNLIYSDVKQYTLTGLNSVLASFKPFPCDVKGKYYFRAYTDLGVDIDRSNDTVRRTFTIIKSNDVAITKVLYPKDGQILSYPASSKQPNVTVENMGDANQGDAFDVYCRIYYNDSLIYRDSVTTNSFRTIPSNVLFKSFKPLWRGYYRMVTFTDLYNDQYRKNDTVITVFASGIPDDVEVVSISPQINTTLQMGTVYATKVTVRNNGYKPQTIPFPLAFKVSHAGNIIYSKTINITIDSGKTKTFDIDSTLSLDSNVIYDVTVYTDLAKDFIKTNDILTGTYGTAKSFDVGVMAILYPAISDTLLIGTQNVIPKVRIANMGDSLVRTRFSTNVKISLLSNTSIVIYNKRVDTSLLLSDTVDIEFPAFGFTGAPQDVKVTATTELLYDQFAGNNTATSTGRFMLLYDVLPVEILKPQPSFAYLTSDAPIKPQVRIKNQGSKKMNSLYTRVIIKMLDTVSMAETEVYRDSVSVTDLLPSETRVVDLARNFVFSSRIPGVYKCYLDNLSPNDQNPLNNQLVSQFRISKGTGVDGVSLVTWSIYPNPADAYLMVDLGRQPEQPLLLEIVDVYGKIVLSGNMDNSQAIFDISKLATGTYFVRVGTSTIKFIVRH